MLFKIELTRANLKMFSSVCANLVVLWLATVFATNDLFVLTRALVLVVLFWYLGVKAEELSENYEFR